jgi:hypothetical protein
MKTKHIIIGLIIVLVVLFFVQKKEHAGSTPPNLSNEAIQNIAKIYADTNNTAVFNNIKTTGEATIPTIKGATTVDGAITLKGATTADGPTTLNGDTLFNGKTTFKSSVANMPSHFPFSDGTNYIRGPTQIDGLATFNNPTNFKGGNNPNNWGTHLPYSNGENYIRGTTNIDGYVRMNNGFQGSFRSPGGAYRLEMQDDGNLVVYRNSDGRPIWDSK